MITLLLVLFIVLFALSKMDQAKYKEFQAVRLGREGGGCLPWCTGSTKATTDRDWRSQRRTDQLHGLRRPPLARRSAPAGHPGRRHPDHQRRSGLVEGLVADSASSPGRLGSACRPSASRSSMPPVQRADGAIRTTSRSRATRTTAHHRWPLRQQLGAVGGPGHAGGAADDSPRSTAVASGQCGGAGIRPIPPGGPEHVDGRALAQNRRVNIVVESGPVQTVSPYGRGDPVSGRRGKQIRESRLPAHQTAGPVPRPGTVGMVLESFARLAITLSPRCCASPARFR